MLKKFIYLDNAATTPLSKNVLKKINSTYKNYWSNTSSTYKYGIKCAIYLEKIRIKKVKLLRLIDEITEPKLRI